MNYKIINIKESSIIAIIAIILVITYFGLISNGMKVNGSFENDIITTSLEFVGVVLALLFTLIILPLQKILDKYTQELVNRITSDQTFSFCLYFFISLFAYDFFALAIFPVFESTNYGFILLIISFSGGMLSLMVLLMFIKRIFYILDIRHQIDEINDDMSILTDEHLIQIDIIADIIQTSVIERRFEISEHGLKVISDRTNNYLIDNDNLTGNDQFISKVVDILMNTIDAISKDTNIIILDSIIDISKNISDMLLDKQDKELSPLIREFIGLLDNIFLKNGMKKAINIKLKVLSIFLELGKKSIDVNNVEIFSDITSILGNVDKYD